MKWLNWVNARLPISQFFTTHFKYYVVGKNVNYWYVLGAILCIVLVSQIISGIFLTMYYTPTQEDAFASIERFMREVRFGWLIRTLHSTGASAFMALIYLHLFKAILYGSYQKPRELLWMSGLSLYFIAAATAYTGYILPWGQMSYWATKVILSLLSVIPWVGDQLIILVQGDYYVSGVTLHRLFSFHVVALPLGLLGMVLLHVACLHSVGGNNPDGIDLPHHADQKTGRPPKGGMPYYPLLFVKELQSLVFFLILFACILFFMPTLGGIILESDNFIPANPLVTPLHIKPAWYFSAFYAILRAIPNKTLGVIALVSSLGVFAWLPWLDRSPVKSYRYRGVISRSMLCAWVISFCGLTVLGTLPATGNYLLITRILIFFYFAFFLLQPIYSQMEKTRPVPKDIPAIH